jgi:hypothetical protein
MCFQVCTKKQWIRWMMFFEYDTNPFQCKYKL